MKKELFSGKKILIVEDDFSSRLYLNKILEKTGAELINAGDGQEAVNIISANPGISLILMDIQLPVMDGFMASRKIREISKNIIIIAQTAYGFQADKKRIIESGFNDFMIKPILSDALLNKIISALQVEDAI